MMSNIAQATLQDGRVIDYFTDSVGEGAEKICHFTTDGKHALLFFNSQVNTSDPGRLERLQFIIDRYNPTVGQEDGDYWGQHFCWPTAIVTKPTLGILTPKYPERFFFPKGEQPFSGKEKQGRWFTGRKARTLLPVAERGDWLGYLRLGIVMARAVRRMHSAGLAHSDLSNKNVLVDPQSGSAIIIDIDTLVVPGRFAPKVLGTKGYVAPEVVAGKALPSMKTDLHALSVLLYEYLLLRHPLSGPKIHSTESAEADEVLAYGERALFIEHPTDRSNAPRSPLKPPVEALGQYLAPLFHRAFVDGLHAPDVRPNAADWETALYRTTDLLLPCPSSSCEAKWFVLAGAGQPSCPSCGATYQHRVPVLNLYAERRAGTFVTTDRRLALFNGWGAHLWHVYTDRRAGAPGVDRTRQAYAVLHNGAWHFVNERLDHLTIDGDDIPRGGSVILQDGMKIRLSSEENGFLAVVQMFG
jgi:hypothetical protein